MGDRARGTVTALLTAFAVTTSSAFAQVAPPTLTPVSVIGCDFCEGPEQFGSVTALAVDDSTVAVGDRDAPHVRLFDLDGSFRASLERDGEGPG